MSAKQRTLLPYRLHRELCAELILEEIDWREECGGNDDVRRLIERLTQTAEWIDAQRVYSVLSQFHNNDVAMSLVEDLWHACKAVWLFEREWMFPHGFALVPTRRILVTDLTPFQKHILPLLGGAA